MPRQIIPYNANLKVLAKQLRNDSTLGEILLWKELKDKKFRYDFHRQKPLLNYIVDFYCAELALIIEIDGRYHNCEDSYNRDLLRDEDLSAFNLTVIRFTEHEVRNDMNNVLRTIETYISTFEAKNREII